MSPNSLRSDCRKFAPNIFNASKCSNCFKQKEEHSAEALECNRASRKIAKCGYLFVAPGWDFSIPLNRTKRWQRRWFVLYDDGELNYSVDEHPDTVPQASVDMTQVLEVAGAEDITGHSYSLAITAPDRVTFVKATCREDARWWTDVLSVFPRNKGRHKRNATFPGGQTTTIHQTQAITRSGTPNPLRPRYNSCHSESLVRGRPPPPPALGWSSEPGPQTHHILQPNCTPPRDIQQPISTPPQPMPTNLSENRQSYRDQPASSASPPTRDKLNSEEKARTRRSSQRSSLTHDWLDSKPSQENQEHQRILNEYEQQYKRDEKLKDIAAVLTRPRLHNSTSSLVSPNITSSDIVNTPTRDSDSTDDEHNRQISIESAGSDVVDGISDKLGSPELSPQPYQNTELRVELPAEDLLNLKKGWLMQQVSGRPKEWNKHWFVLCGSTLTAYRDPDAEDAHNADAVVNLNSIASICEVQVARNYGFQIKMWNDKSTILSAVTAGIRANWMSAIKKAAGLDELPPKPTLQKPTSFEEKLQRELSSNLIQNLEKETGSPPTPVTPRSILFSSDEEYRTASEGGRRESGDWADSLSALPPSPPLNRTPISRVKDRARSRSNSRTRLYKRSKSSPPSSRNSTLDSVSTEDLMRASICSEIIENDNDKTDNEIELHDIENQGAITDSSIIEMLEAEVQSLREQLEKGYKNNLSGEKQIIEIEELRKKLKNAVNDLNNSEQELIRLRKIKAESILRERKMEELLTTLEKTEQQLTQQRLKNADDLERLKTKYSKDKDVWDQKLLNNTRLYQETLEKYEKLSIEFQENKRKNILLQEEVNNLNDRLQRGIEEYDYLHKKLQQLKSKSKSYEGLSRSQSFGSLSNLSYAPDIDPNSITKDSLLEEYHNLKSRFERAVIEIKAMKKELRDSNQKFDDLEISNITLKQDIHRLEESKKSEVQLMAARIQDLVTKLTSSEKQVRNLKSKLQDSREKRRSLSLKGRESFSINKEVEDKITELEAKILTLEVPDSNLKTSKKTSSTSTSNLRVVEKKKLRRDRSSDRGSNSPIDDKSLRRLRRKSLDSATTSEPMKLLIRLSSLESKVSTMEKPELGEGGLIGTSRESLSVSSTDLRTSGKEVNSELRSTKEVTSELRSTKEVTSELRSTKDCASERMEQLHSRKDCASERMEQLRSTKYVASEKPERTSELRSSKEPTSERTSELRSSKELTSERTSELRSSKALPLEHRSSNSSTDLHSDSITMESSENSILLDLTMKSVLEKLDDSLTQISILKHGRRITKILPENLDPLETSLRETLEILQKGVVANTSNLETNISKDEFSVITESVLGVVKSYELLLKSKLLELNGKRSNLKENGKLTPEVSMQILAEKLAYEAILIGRIHEALDTPEFQNLYSGRILKREIVETSQLMKILRNKLNGSCIKKYFSSKISEEYLTRVLTRKLIQAGLVTNNNRSQNGKDWKVNGLNGQMEYLLAKQKDLNGALQKYKSQKLETLAYSLAVETLNYSNDTDCRLERKSLEDIHVKEAWKQAQETVSNELIQTEISHVMMRCAQMYESNITTNHSAFFSFYASERAALELWTDTVEEKLRKEMDSSIQELTLAYKTSLSKLKQQSSGIWRRRVESERNSNKSRLLLLEFADVIAHKALIDSRIAVLIGETKSQNSESELTSEDQKIGSGNNKKLERSASKENGKNFRCSGNGSRNSFNSSRVLEPNSRVSIGYRVAENGIQYLENGFRVIENGSRLNTEPTSRVSISSKTLESGTQLLENGSRLTEPTSRVSINSKTMESGTQLLENGSRLTEPTSRISINSKTLESGTQLLENGTRLNTEPTARVSINSKTLESGTQILENGSRLNTEPTSRVSINSKTLESGTQLLENGSRLNTEPTSRVSISSKTLESGTQLLENGSRVPELGSKPSEPTSRFSIGSQNEKTFPKDNVFVKNLVESDQYLSIMEDLGVLEHDALMETEFQFLFQNYSRECEKTIERIDLKRQQERDFGYNKVLEAIQTLENEIVQMGKTLNVEINSSNIEYENENWEEICKKCYELQNSLKDLTVVVTENQECKTCRELRASIDRLSKDHEKQLDNLKRRQEKSISSLRIEFEKEKSNLLIQHQSEQAQLKERASILEQRLGTLDSEYSLQLDNLRQAYRTTLNRNLEKEEGDENIRQRYQAEIEHLRNLCEKGLMAIENSHRRVVLELEDKHRKEREQLSLEKEQALAEETQATLAALDAMRKAHENEVQREIAKFKEDFIKKMQATHDIGALHKEHEAEMREIKQEILSLSERYSVKCVESASLEEQLEKVNRQLAQAQQHIQQLDARNKQLRAHILSEDVCFLSDEQSASHRQSRVNRRGSNGVETCKPKLSTLRNPQLSPLQN